MRRLSLLVLVLAVGITAFNLIPRRPPIQYRYLPGKTKVVRVSSPDTFNHSRVDSYTCIPRNNTGTTASMTCLSSDQSIEIDCTSVPEPTLTYYC